MFRTIAFRVSGLSDALFRFVRLPALFGRFLIDAILPPRCLKCSKLVGAPESLCSTCWSDLRFLSQPCCACCGYPFDIEAASDTLCATCLAKHPPYRRARAALAYDDGCRDMILAFKNADRMELAKPFSRWMTQAGGDLLAEAELLVPVPLHWRRLLSRRYNQAALLAMSVAKLNGKLAIPDLLRRQRSTEKQGHLSRLGRRRNVSGAFMLREGGEVMIAGKRVLLIDDVVTTGATVEGCCRILLAAGAASVDVLSLAQVIRPR